MSNIEERVIKVLAEQLCVPESELTYEKNFVNDLGADSLDIIEIIIALEHELEIEIYDHEAEAITTVGKALDCAKSKLN